MTGADPLPEQAVAVVGMACRFPGAPDVSTYWQNLCAGVESVAFYPLEQLIADGFPRELVEDERFVPATGELADSDLFDAAYFGFSPREAEVLDPQHRVFLECAVHGLEDANVVPGADRRVAVFGGAGMNNYLLRNVLPHPDVVAAVGGHQVVISNDKDYFASRVAYKLGLSGPAMTVQTACSTSLYAVHLACRTLLMFEADVALAGGATVGIPQRRGYIAEPGSISSPDGHCRPYDAGAAGLPAGSGVGVVVLKRLEDAVADRDTIHAVILGSATNNDGDQKVGFTAPSVVRQADVITEALEVAGVEARTIGYVEGHGTATPLGDPIEVTALTRAFRASTSDTAFCGLGSVKSNFGHLDAAAGVAGLIKAILSIEHATIAPSLNFERPNPHTGLESSPFYVPIEARSWERSETPRRAGVSSFGLGGTNAHIVLQERPAPPRTSESPWPQLLNLSARDPAALASARKQLADHLESHTEDHLADVAHTLQHGRRAHPLRSTVVAGNRAEAISALRVDEQVEPTIERRDRPLVFMFPGVTAVEPGCGGDLYTRYPAFRKTVDEVSDTLEEVLGVRLAAVVAPDGADCLTRATGDLARPAVAACATWMIEVASARLLGDLGFRPAALVGHSLGEHAAAAVAGVTSIADTARLVAQRYDVLERHAPGGMVSLLAPVSDVDGLLGPRCSVAAFNTPDSCVVSGPPDELADLVARCEEMHIPATPLGVKVATHSKMLDPYLHEWTACVAAVEHQPARVPWASTLTGCWVDPEEVVGAEYWTRQMREPVRFADAVDTLREIEDAVLVEVGPGRVLAGLAQACAGGMDPRPVSLLPRPAREDGGVRQLLEAIGTLWRAGVSLEDTTLQGTEERRMVRLPGYPFQRESFWLAPTRDSAVPSQGLDKGDGPGTGRVEVSSWSRLPTLDTRADLESDDGWLLLGPAEAVDEVARGLRGAGASVVCAEPGDRGNLAEGSPGHVVAVATSETGSPSARLDLVRQAAKIVRSVEARESRPRAELLVVTGAAYDVLGGEAQADASQVAGLAESLGAELVVDLGAEADPACALPELLAPRPRSAPVVARRGRHRWGLTWQPSEIGTTTGPGAIMVVGDLHLVGGAGSWSPEDAEVVRPSDGSATEGDPAYLRSLLARAAPGDVLVHVLHHGAGAGPHSMRGLMVSAAALAVSSPDVRLVVLDVGEDQGRDLGEHDDVAGRGDPGPTGIGTAAAAVLGHPATWADGAERPWLVAHVELDHLVRESLRDLVGRLLPHAGRDRVRLRGGDESVDAATETPAATPGASHARRLSEPYVAPRSDVERQLAEIWSDALGVEPVGVHDDFFALGGHSLLGTQVAARVRDVFDIDLALRELFAAATVAEMAEQIVRSQLSGISEDDLESLLAAVAEETPETPETPEIDTSADRQPPAEEI